MPRRQVLAYRELDDVLTSLTTILNSPEEVPLPPTTTPKLGWTHPRSRPWAVQGAPD
jgi:hypothetical protein